MDEVFTNLFKELTLDDELFVQYTETIDGFNYILYYFITKTDKTNFKKNNSRNNFIKITFTLTPTDIEVPINMEFTYEKGTINLIDILPRIHPEYIENKSDIETYENYKHGKIAFGDIIAILEEISDKTLSFNNLSNIRILMPFNTGSFDSAMRLLTEFICNYSNCYGEITRQNRLVYTRPILPAGGKKTKSKQYNKTRRSFLNRNYTPSKIVTMFLEMLNTIKLYHWKTFNFAQHKATDELYSKLNSNIDTFVEIMLGKSGERVNLTGQKTLPLLDYRNLSDFIKEVNKYKQFLIDMNKDSRLKGTNHTDLLSVRDEILGNLNQFTYLLTFK